MPSVGVDFGAKRIGIAVSESDSLAQPRTVILRGDDIAPALDEIAAIAAEIGARTIVVGIPTGGRRAPSANLELYELFAAALRQKTSADVVLWDEGYSTTEAAGLMRETGTKRRDAKSRIDMVAAAVILQSWLDAKRRGRP